LIIDHQKQFIDPERTRHRQNQQRDEQSEDEEEEEEELPKENKTVKIL